MGKVIVAVLMLAVGLGAGFGAGYMLMMPRIDESAAEIEELKAKVTDAEADADDLLKKAGEQINAAKAQAQTQIKKSQDNAISLSADLRKVKLENQRLQAVVKQMMSQLSPESTTAAEPAKPAPTPAASVPTTVAPTASAPTPAVTTKPATSPTGQTVEYTVQQDDNLWKIAANELGSGIRYKEILKLNPDINEKTTLTIGMKLKLPAK